MPPDTRSERTDGPGWEVMAISIGGAGPPSHAERQTWDEALDTVEGSGEALTGDPWLDAHAPPGPNDHQGTSMAGTGPQVAGRPPRRRGRGAVQKDADGGLDSLGANEPGIAPTAEDAQVGYGEMAVFGEANAIPPPVSFAFLLRLVRNSPSLRQNIDAYVRNIEGHGWRLVPIIDPEAADAEDRVRGVIFAERVHEQRVLQWQGEEDKAEAVVFDVTDAEVRERVEEISAAMAVEKVSVETFFRNVNPRMSWTSLRKRKRGDLETIGNAAQVVTRNAFGDPLHVWYVPAYSVRLVRVTPEDRNVEATERILTSPISSDVVTVRRTFRRYVQGLSEYGLPVVPVVGHSTEGGGKNEGFQLVFLKELGDPRAIGRTTGKVYADDGALKRAIAAEEEDGPAEELLYSTLPSAGDSVYGLVRWEGQVTGAMGEVESEQTNLLFFANDAIPDMMLLVAGAKFAQGARKEIETHIRTKLKGKKRDRGILVLEAKAGTGKGSGTGALVGDAPVPRITAVPMTQFQRTDGQYAVYSERKGNQIDSAFGNPPQAVGKYKGVGARAVMRSLEKWAEKNVYEPERKESDDEVNRRLLSALGVKYWRFESLAPVDRDPRELIELAEVAVRAGIITIDEARLVAGDAFSVELPEFGDPEWSKMPLPVFLASLQAGLVGFGAPAEGEPGKKVAGALDAYLARRSSGALSRGDVLDMLDGLRGELVEHVSGLAKEAEQLGIDEHNVRELLAEAEAGGDVEHLEVPATVLRSWLEPMPALGESS